MITSSRYTLLFAILLPLTIMFSSCKDDFDPTSELNGSKSDIISMLQSDDVIQRASIDSDNFKYVSSNGTIVEAEINSFEFKESGLPANGLINFEMTELFTKSEILRYGIVTESFGSILESDGEFFFSASQDGQPLGLAVGKRLKLQVPNSNPNTGMQLFSIGEGSWWPQDNALNTILSENQAAFSGYEFFVDRLEWVNIDYFTKFDRELTDISICLPEGYRDASVISWIVFRDLDIVLNSSGENLPIGEVASIVCIASVDEETFRLDIQEVTIEEGLKVNLSPKEESIEKIKKLLKELD